MKYSLLAAVLILFLAVLACSSSPAVTPGSDRTPKPALAVWDSYRR